MLENIVVDKELKFGDGETKGREDIKMWLSCKPNSITIIPLPLIKWNLELSEEWLKLTHLLICLVNFVLLFTKVVRELDVHNKEKLRTDWEGKQGKYKKNIIVVKELRFGGTKTKGGEVSKDLIQLQTQCHLDKIIIK